MSITLLLAVSMPSNSTNTFRLGFLDALPFTFVVAPFAVLFGVVAIEAGLHISQALAFSMVVVAGASQFAALQQMVEQAPVVIVVLTAMAVNLRMAMYSASLTPWLGAAPMWQRALLSYALVDQAYASSITRFEENPDWSVPQRVAYYFGVVALILPFWMVCTGFGIWAGAGIPEWMALDFALPICFLALIGPMMRTLAHVLAVLTSVALSLLLAGLPYGSGLLLAALVAMMVGAQTELWLEKRKPE